MHISTKFIIIVRYLWVIDKVMYIMVIVTVVTVYLVGITYYQMHVKCLKYPNKFIIYLNIDLKFYYIMRKNNIENCKNGGARSIDYFDITKLILVVQRKINWKQIIFYTLWCFPVIISVVLNLTNERFNRSRISINSKRWIFSAAALFRKIHQSVHEKVYLLNKDFPFIQCVNFCIVIVT